MNFTFEGYDVGERLYDGPGSHVYQARRLADDEPTILKVLKPALPPPERLAAFRREYELQRDLKSAGVVRAYALETDQRSWVLVQEDIGGQSLDRALAGQPATLDARLTIAIAIVDALGELHERNVIHKDINPANVVVNPRTGQVALIDLGIATALTRERPTLRPPDRLVGTLAYIAPEQTGRMNRDVDYRSDFYALGATLYKLFTGELPFAADDPMELVHCHIARLPEPAHVRNPELPEMLSGIIAKLMAKMAEARYQSSFGIKADLERCQRRLSAGEPAGPDLPLASNDVSEVFQIPQRLYGREPEVETLLAAFDRISGASATPGVTDVSEPRAQLVLVKGYSGIGKSALVHEMHVAITRRRGYFTSGKFDQLQRGIPYMAVAAALRGLTRQLLGEPSERLAHWREDLQTALGQNGRLITELVPELELIVGPQPPVNELGPTESQNRFNLVFQSLIRALARPSHPLVLFLDDLQWAGAESLKLLELMLSGLQAGHLLLIGAYRDNEVDQAHPLMITIDALRQAGVEPAQIHVSPLPPAHVGALVADTLHAAPDDAAPLAQLVLRKTEGNPLFVKQLLMEVHHQGLIRFDRQRGRWGWDLKQIESQAVTTNVVELMLGKLRRLPEATQDVLRSGACLGNQFALETLAVILDQPIAETFAALLPAIREGLALPATEPELALPSQPGAPLAAQEYRFLHDRVQQAAYSLMDPDQRKAVHLRAGRMLLRKASPQERQDSVFEIVDQLNHGRELIDDPKERELLARHNALAGRKAKAAAAYRAARAYLAIALELLAADTWTTDHAFAARVHRELSDAEALVGNFARAEELTGELLAHATGVLDRAEAHNLLLNQRTVLGRYEDALETARVGLGVLDIDLPKENIEQALGAEAVAIQAKLGDRPIASLYDAPTVEDPWAQAAMKMLVSTLPASFYTNPMAYGLVILKAVRISLEHGLSPQSADLFAYYGHLLCFTQGQYKAGHQFGELSIRLSDKFSSPGDKCRSSFITANFILAWVKHLRHSRPLNDDGYQAGLVGGEVLFGGYILFYKVFHPFYEGAPLERVLADLPAYLRFNQQAKNQLAIDFLVGFDLALAPLLDPPDGPAPERASEADTLAEFAKNQSQMAVCYFHIVKTQVSYLLGDPSGALAEAERAEKIIDTIAGNVATAEHNFYASLCLAALLPEAAPAEREAYEAKLAAYHEQMAIWAESCPENFTHMHTLVAAERARYEGRHHDAADLYERAIQAANDQGFAQDAALANELAGRAWFARGRHRIAAGFMADALFGYRLWGATAKVARLVGEFPELEATRPLHRGSMTTTTTDREGEGALDLSSVLKASRAISSVLHLDKLLSTLIETVIENAGAQRGVLMLDKDGELLVQVDAHVQRRAEGLARPQARGVVMRELEPCPVSSYGDIAERVVAYVRRTRETVILRDAANEGSFTTSPYVVREQPKSVLAMPVSGQGRLLGVLYLENNLTTGAFTPSRLEVLDLLASQAGISLDNALLFSELEQRVAARTVELRQRNEDVERALENLKTAQAQLIHAEKMASLGRLSTGIAHEIKNPLNFIINFAEATVEIADELLETLDDDSAASLADAREDLDDVKDGCQRILSHGRRADDIIRGMTEHASTGSVERRPVNLNDLLDQYVNLAYQGATADHQDLNISLARDYDDEVGEIEANPQQLTRVLVNLLNNAFDAVLDHHKTAGPDFAASVKISTRRAPGQVELRVTDNGGGVAPEIRGKIFEPFFTTKPPGSGTGLGLSICHDVIVEAHGGSITLEDRQPHGSCFVVTIPSS